MQERYEDGSDAAGVGLAVEQPAPQRHRRHVAVAALERENRAVITAHQDTQNNCFVDNIHNSLLL